MYTYIYIYMSSYIHIHSYKISWGGHPKTIGTSPTFGPVPVARPGAGWIAEPPHGPPTTWPGFACWRCVGPSPARSLGRTVGPLDHGNLEPVFQVAISTIMYYVYIYIYI